MSTPRIFGRGGRADALALRFWTLPALAGAGLAAMVAIGQPAPVNGPRQVDPRWHAIVNATLVARPGQTLDDATIVLRDGVIVSVKAGAEPPEGARVWDYTGLTVYAGLIDAHAPVDAPPSDRSAPGAHWSPKVTPQRSALDGAGLDAKAKKELRDIGFAAAMLAPSAGVFRGQTAVVLLDGDADAGASGDLRPDVVASSVFQEVSFDSGGWGRDEYPSSLMGAIAMIRQTMFDADWHAQSAAVYRRDPSRHEPVAPQRALLALGANGAEALPLLFNTADELEAIRAAKIAREFDRRFAIVGSGTEFRRLDAIADDGAAIILPLNFPEKPKVESLAEAHGATLRDLMTWEQAPTNPRRLAAAGVRVALTTDKLKKRGDFHANLRLAIDHGLSEEKALAMLTTDAAEILGVGDRLGAVEPGKLANLVAVKGSLFEEKAKIRDVWVAGARYEISSEPEVVLAGSWKASFGDIAPVEGELVIDDKNAITCKAVEKKSKARAVTVRENRVGFLLDGEPFGDSGVWTLSAMVEGEGMYGVAVGPGGKRLPWTATKLAATTVDEQKESAGDAGEGEEKKKKKETDEEKAAKEKQKRLAGIPEELPTPFGAYGLMSAPEQKTMLITGAIIWTSGPAGIIENGVMIVSGGKVQYVGPAAGAPRIGAGHETIDAAGKHITPGLIDCHSHTGVSGSVNEGTQAVTSEVRIADCIDPDDISFYRQLAGGLTAANQLHGSANPIGGQNSVVKLRWGVGRPDDMRLEGAIEGIKFALGENVKQSNWGDRYNTRYPQTRMGVETIIRDRFIAARDYAAARERREAMPSAERERTMPVRRDLELDALAEILAGRRLVHCHSYRQDEILMLCRAAQEFGFTIGTFQHVLEGYKVAEAIKEAALGGSSFSDWWAYKFEVYDAIPENGAIMHEVGVAVSFNSDSDELARRMNAEAAKAVKYGGVAPAEALKFVTLNPAKQLKIEDRVGSLESGKDADFVIWSGDPLSAFSRCEATYIDGREYFSLSRDAELRAAADAEKHRLVQKILSLEAKAGAMARGRGGAKDDADGPADDGPVSLIERIEAQARERHFMELMRAGIDPEAHRCGDCGMTELGYLNAR